VRRSPRTADTRAVPPHAGRSRAGVRHRRTDPRACGGTGGPGASPIPRVGSHAGRDTQRAGACGGEASPGDTPINAHGPDSGRACGLHASGGDGASPSGGSVRIEAGAAGAASDRPREAWHGLRLDGPPMTTQTTRRIAPSREGQGVLLRVTFTPGESVGYNAHHGEVCYVAHGAAVATARARGPPAGTGEPRACPGLTIHSDRRWCTAEQANHQSHQTEAAAPRSYQLRTGLRACQEAFYASKHPYVL